jgi:hypothetical protein
MAVVKPTSKRRFKQIVTWSGLLQDDTHLRKDDDYSSDLYDLIDNKNRGYHHINNISTHRKVVLTSASGG